MKFILQILEFIYLNIYLLIIRTKNLYFISIKYIVEYLWDSQLFSCYRINLGKKYLDRFFKEDGTTKLKRFTSEDKITLWDIKNRSIDVIIFYFYKIAYSFFTLSYFLIYFFFSIFFNFLKNDPFFYIFFRNLVKIYIITKVLFFLPIRYTLIVTLLYFLYHSFRVIILLIKKKKFEVILYLNNIIVKNGNEINNQLDLPKKLMEFIFSVMVPRLKTTKDQMELLETRRLTLKTDFKNKLIILKTKMKKYKKWTITKKK